MISRIGKYTVESELGRGGFGRVYRAYDPDVQRPVAIKVLTAESDPELLKRFQVEIGTTGNLRHKNIVTLHESGEQSGVPYLVMELLEGQTLEHVIKGGVPLTLLEKIRIMTQVAEGLSYAHSKGVIHRDVKPGNIMLLPDGSVKIMDFGIARVANRSTMVTREGYIIGTIPYMAPELFDAGGKADEETDIFAYGVVSYELLTRVHPFSVEGEIYTTVARIKHHEPDAVGRLVPNCPEALELLVHRAIAKDREVRYQSFAELLPDSEAILIDLQHDLALSIMAEVGPLMESGDLEGAESKLQQVVELEPGNREARRLRAGIKDQVRQLDIGRRVSALLAESEAQLRDRKFTEAVQTLENALRLNKNDAGIQARLAEANAKLNGYLEANKLVAEARRDQQKGQLEGALKRLKTALQHDPEHTDARSVFARVEAELDRRAKENAIQDAIRLASEHLAEKRFDDAIAVLKDLETDRTAATRVGELRARIEREKEDADRRRRADQFNVAVARLREALQARELTKASHLLKYISGQFAGEPGTTQLVSQFQAQFDALVRAEAISRYTRQARHLIDQKSLPEALDVIDQALRQFPEDTGLIRLRQSTESVYAAQRRAEAIAEAVQRANGLRELGKLAEALDVIAKCGEALGEDAALNDLARRLELELEQQRYDAGLQELLGRARRMAAAGAYDDAIGTVERASEYGNESEVQALLASARAAVARREEEREIAAALEAARTLERESPERALAALQEALGRHPHDAALSEAANVLRDRVAEEQHRAKIAHHRDLVERAIERKDWKKAEEFLERARRESPGDALFEQLAEQIRRALFDSGLNEVAAKVRESLAENAVSEAAEQIRQTRMIYSGDPRWQSLEQDVAKRKAYESALSQAEHHRNRGELDKAEDRLRDLIREGGPHDRATQMLGAIQDQRFSARIKEADGAIARGDFERGFSLLETMRADAPPSWTVKIDAAYQNAKNKKQEGLARERQQRETEIARIVGTVRRHLELDEVHRAAEECAKGRDAFPGEDVWASLDTEVDARRGFLDVLQRAEQERARGNHGAADSLLASLKPVGADSERVREAREAIASDRARKERADALINARLELERLKRSGNAEATAAFLEDLRRRFPEESEFAKEHDRAVAELARIKARAEALANARGDLEKLKRAGNAEATVAFLGDLRRRFPEESEFAKEHDRALALASGRRELEKLRREGNPQAIVALLEDLRRRFPEESEFATEHDRTAAELARVEALDRKRQDEERRERERAQALTGARQQLERRKRAGNAEATLALLADLSRRFPEVSEFATERDRTAAELALVKAGPVSAEAVAAGAEEKKPLPWKLIGGGIAAAAAIVASLIFIPPLFRPTPVPLSPVEIRTDPPGASVRVGKQTCVTPNCRLELAPGQYAVEARLNGYEPAQQVLTIDRLKQPGPLDLTLQPVATPPPPTEPGRPALAIGTLVVEAGTPNALVFVDNVPRGRTDASGRFTLRLEAKSHEVRVQKPGYQEPREQQVKIADGTSKAVAFSLIAQKATLELRGAPAGVELRLGGTLIGKTNGTLFSAAVQPGDGILQVRDGAAKREIAEKFEPGQTLALNWTSVAPPAIPKPPLPPSAEVIEAQDWERVRNTSDTAELQNFLTKYRNGAHTAQAQSRLEDVVWSQTNQGDAQALRGYINRFPRSPHSADALQRIADSAWSGTDKKDAQALRAFLQQYPNSPHKSDAQNVLDQLEKQRLDAEERLKRQRADQEAQQQSSAEVRGIRSALDRFNMAFESKRTRDVKEIWPTVPGRYIQAMEQPGSSFVMMLRPAGEPKVSGDTTSMPCELITQSTVQGRQMPQAQRAVTVTLRKSGDRWTVADLTAR